MDWLFWTDSCSAGLYGFQFERSFTNIWTLSIWELFLHDSVNILTESTLRNIQQSAQNDSRANDSFEQVLFGESKHTAQSVLISESNQSPQRDQWAVQWVTLINRFFLVNLNLCESFETVTELRTYEARFELGWGGVVKIKDTPSPPPRLVPLELFLFLEQHHLRAK